MYVCGHRSVCKLCLWVPFTPYFIQSVNTRMSETHFYASHTHTLPLSQTHQPAVGSGWGVTAHLGRAEITTQPLKTGGKSHFSCFCWTLMLVCRNAPGRKGQCYEHRAIWDNTTEFSETRRPWEFIQGHMRKCVCVCVCKIQWPVARWMGTHSRHATAAVESHMMLLGIFQRFPSECGRLKRRPLNY